MWLDVKCSWEFYCQRLTCCKEKLHVFILHLTLSPSPDETMKVLHWHLSPSGSALLCPQGRLVNVSYAITWSRIHVSCWYPFFACCLKHWVLCIEVDKLKRWCFLFCFCLFFPPHHFLCAFCCCFLFCFCCFCFLFVLLVVYPRNVAATVNMGRSSAGRGKWIKEGRGSGRLLSVEPKLSKHSCPCLVCCHGYMTIRHLVHR